MDVDDVDVDAETLQAQIDISTSLADDLVASWIKPAFKNSVGGSSAGRVTEKEIEEYVRRPPRLGVGAAVPGVAGREVMKLKGQLLASGKGKKRDRQEVHEMVVATRKRGDESEDEDSRAGAIRKKAKVDAFGGFGIKKGKGQSQTPLARPSAGSSAAVKTDGSKGEPGSVASPDESLASSHAASRKSSISNTNTKDNPQILVTQPASSIGVELSVLPASVNLSKNTKDTGPASRASDTPASLKQLSGSALPLLNLEGPPLHTGPSGGESAKKRRKRRKKKKNVNPMGEGAGGV
ncbi:hypothetical protein NEOLEDRAFT_1175047 [Neolentinus lepideus HHB14362 ss-1]|uniref:Uncharacterized protein n=1 Tax=Neolentinus lepideus HHB14362 ss-1 TaxID=1314782 RepID=A0A165V8W4_9AGAM|nr:hypothetical protein NEOLEDRAFT_1175047 [Neolentinus lepideus HHB14362 ss-1]